MLQLLVKCDHFQLPKALEKWILYLGLCTDIYFLVTWGLDLYRNVGTSMFLWVLG